MPMARLRAWLRRVAPRLVPIVSLPGALLVPNVAAAAVPEPFRIDVVEAGSGWPVPLVELRTNHHERWHSDNGGVVALDDPDLMGHEVWLGVTGHGYEVPRDGFGNRGVRIRPVPGGRHRIELRRTQVARRLGRLTGSGLFAETRKLGMDSPATEGSILGCDSVQAAVHRGQLHWFWGDTTLARYPLGIFDGTGATSGVPFLERPEPPVVPRLTWWKDGAGRPMAIAPMPGEGPTWITGCASVPDASGTARMVAAYMKIRPPLEAREWGLCTWDDDAHVFRPLKTVWRDAPGTDGRAAKTPPPQMPEGHAARWRDGSGREWLLFGNPFPRLRCPATFEGWSDPARWEPLKPQETLSDPHGAPVEPHSGSIAWNPWRKRWVTVFMQRFGKPSAFGELWYAEADSPSGPWGTAVKVVTHENYTFYNPRLHPESSPAGSPVLLFEATFTLQFADKPVPVARHDYNQVLHRLDLDDPRLAPAHGRTGE